VLGVLFSPGEGRQEGVCSAACLCPFCNRRTINVLDDDDDDVKRQWGCRKHRFSVLSVVTFSETLELKPTLLYSDLESLVGFYRP